jgi:hypothetical protein
MATRRYVFFLAHAGRDTARAEQFYDLLAAAGVPAFLDSRCLLPGDEWDIELRRAQREALATVALVSVPVEPAYYFRAEIAWAIAKRRSAPDQHRLIPVYLDGLPMRPEDIPSGLEPLHALDAVRLGLDGVAESLARTASILAERADAAPAPVATRGTAEPEAEDTAIAPQVAVIQLYECLVRLMDTQFDVVVLYVAAPHEFLPPRTAPLATRALGLAGWAQQGGAPRLTQVRAAIRRVAPDLC